MKNDLKAARSYENLVTQLIQRGKSWPEKLNLLMAYSLTPPIKDDPKFNNAFVEKPDLYDQFIRKYFPNMSALETACFITLNYDCLLERALCRCYHHPTDPNELRCFCRHIDYQLHAQSDDIFKIKVFKPHGSINWIADMTLGDQPYIPDTVATIDQDDSEDWTKVDIVDSPKHKGHAKIAVAHYAREKKAQINRDLLKTIRCRSLKQVEQATSVTIIGVHMPNKPGDDPFLDSFFDLASRRARNGLPVYFINISEAQLREASSRGFIPKHSTFADYVEH